MRQPGITLEGSLVQRLAKGMNHGLCRSINAEPGRDAPTTAEENEIRGPVRFGFCPGRAVECCHGCSAAAAQPTKRNPWSPVSSFHSAPEAGRGSAGHRASFAPAGARRKKREGDFVPFPTGCAASAMADYAPPVATTRGPAGAGGRILAASQFYQILAASLFYSPAN